MVSPTRLPLLTSGWGSTSNEEQKRKRERWGQKKVQKINKDRFPKKSKSKLSPRGDAL